MEPNRWNLGRRRILETMVVSGALGVSGCLGDGDGDDGEDARGDEERVADDNGDEAHGENGDEDSDERDDGIGGDEDERENIDEPVEFPEDRSCAICNMEPQEYPDWNAQLVHEDGYREFFCSAGCMSAYYVDPERFEGPDSRVETVWVSDFETGDLFDASEGYFVRVTDPDHVDDIMMMNPTPFADESDAHAFVEEFDEYDENDVITLEAFDYDLALLYRSRFLEEDNGNGHENADDNGHNGHSHGNDDEHDHSDSGR